MHDISELNYYTKDVEVEIKHDKNTGFYLIGSEYHIRNTALRLIYDSASVKVRRRESSSNKQPINEAIRDIFYEQDIFVNKHILDAIVNYVLIASKHILLGRNIDNSNLILNVYISDELYKLSSKILTAISALNICEFSENEIRYFSFFLKGNIEKDHLISKDRFDRFGIQAKKWEEFAFGFLTDLLGQDIHEENLKKELFNFFYSFGMRLELNIQRRTMVHDTVLRKFEHSYMLANKIFSDIAFNNKIYVYKEEIAYLSLLINTHYFESDYSSKNMLVILPSDYVVARSLRVQLNNLYRCKIDYCSFSESSRLNNETVNRYDVVVNTYDRVYNVEGDNVVTIFEVISPEDEEQIFKYLKIQNYNKIRQYLGSSISKSSDSYVPSESVIEISFDNILLIIDNKSSKNEIVVYSKNDNMEIIEVNRCDDDINLRDFIKIITSVSIKEMYKKAK